MTEEKLKRGQLLLKKIACMQDILADMPDINNRLESITFTYRNEDEVTVLCSSLSTELQAICESGNTVMQHELKTLQAEFDAL